MNNARTLNLHLSLSQGMVAFVSLLTRAETEAQRVVGCPNLNLRTGSAYQRGPGRVARINPRYIM